MNTNCDCLVKDTVNVEYKMNVSLVRIFSDVNPPFKIVKIY